MVPPFFVFSLQSNYQALSTLLPIKIHGILTYRYVFLALQKSMGLPIIVGYSERFSSDVSKSSSNTCNVLRLDL